MSACERLQWWTSTVESELPHIRGQGSRKDPMPEGQSRGATPGLRSGAAADSARAVML